MASHAPKLEKAKADLDEALKSGDKKAIAEARSVYERTAKNITINNKRFKDMSEETCAKLSNLNETAVNYANGNMPMIYTMNYNAFGETEKIAGYSFALVNENAVKNMISTGDLSLYKHVDVPKDVAWNEKFINSQITQGILQGESIPEMSKRIFPELMRKTKIPDIGIMKRNQNSATRIARTMTTAAENKGRQDSFKKAQDDGVIMEREWISAHDSHTRAWHADLHGVRVGIDEPWENDYGEIMYPGDPTADAANVYNCRCSIRAHVKGFAWNKNTIKESQPSDVVYTRYTSDDDKKVNSMYYDQVKKYSSQVISAIRRYTGDSKTTKKEYEKINNYLRNGGTISKANSDTIKNLDQAISNFEVKEAFTARRGLGLDTFNELLPGISDATSLNDMKDALIGAEFMDPGYMSSSWNVWGGFVRDAYLEIDIPKGRGYGLMVGNVTSREEREFIIKRGTHLEIYDIDKDKHGDIIIHSRIVED